MTANADVPARLLDWDSTFFGFRIARLLHRKLTREVVEHTLGWCKQNRIRCLYFRAASDDPQTTQLAEEHKFHHVDGRLVLDRQLGDISRTSILSVRPWRPSDVSILQKIAAASHRDSRFYFDHGFPNERCDALYETWIDRSCHGYAQQVLVALSEDQPAGYITCHLSEEIVGSIGLMAVAPGAQRRGLGRDLVNASLCWFSEQAATHVSVETQTRNVAAQRLYQACGFRSCAFDLWYHWWSPDER